MNYLQQLLETIDRQHGAAFDRELRAEIQAALSPTPAGQLAQVTEELDRFRRSWPDYWQGAGILADGVRALQRARVDLLLAAFEIERRGRLLASCEAALDEANEKVLRRGSALMRVRDINYGPDRGSGEFRASAAAQIAGEALK